MRTKPKTKAFTATIENLVCELHRLYSVQKMLMEDLDSTTFERFDSWKATIDSSAIVFENSLKNKINSQCGNNNSLKDEYLDLQLPADQYIRQAGVELPKTECVRQYIKRCPEIKHSLAGKIVSDVEEVKLSLSFGNQTRDKIYRNGIWYSNNIYSCRDIKLEESSEWVFRGEIELQASVPSNKAILKNGDTVPAQGSAVAFSHMDYKGSNQEQIPMKQDIESHFPHEKMFAKERQSTLRGILPMDLNNVHLDDPTCSSKDLVVPQLSTPGLSNRSCERDENFPESSHHAVTCWRKPDDGCSNKSVDMLEKTKSEVLSNDPEFVPSLVPDLHEDPGSHCSYLNDLVSEHPNAHSQDESSTEIPRTYGCGENEELDDLIQRAAESLICLSLESPGSYKRCYSKEPLPPLNELDCEEQQPQHSSDSFESNTLRLTESVLEDCTVTSKCFEANEMVENFGCKLRRGRRLKDFRRDILPGLPSLSSNEIFEDISIFHGVLRSREYKKFRSRMADGENWSTPARSKRSRVKYGRRRN